MSTWIPPPVPNGPDASSPVSRRGAEMTSPIDSITTAGSTDNAPANPRARRAARNERPCRAVETRPRTRRRSFPIDLSPANLVAVVDSREQNPLDLAPLRQIPGTLATGDYSLRGLESVVAIERKSLVDLLACIGQERDRFHREVHRLLAYPVRALVVESTWPEIERGQWRSKVRAPAALGTILNWISLGLPVIMAGDHARAGRYASRILFVAARRRWREARALLPPD
jgi:DNA excision repair protein ERCC-4